MRSIVSRFVCSIALLAKVDSLSRVPSQWTSHPQGTDASVWNEPILRRQVPESPATIQRRADQGTSWNSTRQDIIASMNRRPLTRTPIVHMHVLANVRDSRSPDIERSRSAPPYRKKQQKPGAARISGKGTGPANIHVDGTEVGAYRVEVRENQQWRLNMNSKFSARVRVETLPATNPTRTSMSTVHAQGYSNTALAVHTLGGGYGLVRGMASNSIGPQAVSPGSAKLLRQRAFKSKKLSTTGTFIGLGAVVASVRSLPTNVDSELSRAHST